MVETALSEVCQVIAGQSPPSSSYNQVGIGNPFFQGKADFGEIYPTVRFWCTEPKKMSYPGDILFSVRAPVGPTNINQIEASIGRGLAAIRCGSNIDQKYLLHYLRGSEEKIAALGTGSTFSAITIGTLKDIKIPLPPLATQKKIAAILDAADAHRQKTRQLLAKYDELAQSIFLEMFGDPVTNPKGWEVKSLVDCTTKIGSGATPRGGKDAYKEEGVSLIRSLNIHDNEFKLKNLAFIDSKQANDLKNVIVEKGDVLFNITGASVCRCCIVPEEILPARVNQHVSILRPNENIDSEFLVYFMTSKNQKQKLLELATKGGATREAITKQDLQDMEVLVPDIMLQQKFSSALNNIRKQILTTRVEVSDSENLFNSLLQKAFKGDLM